MENKRSAQNLKQLIIICVILMITGIVIGILNLGQVNDKIASLTKRNKII